MRKIKQNLRHENKVNKNKVFSYFEALRYKNIIKTMKKLLLIISNLQSYSFQNMFPEKWTKIQEASG